MTSQNWREFKISVDECDVEDNERLIEYRAKRIEWLQWLRLDGDEHAIWRQIYGMLWNDALFRTINESRRIAKEVGESAALNGPLSRFIDQSYVATQVLAIRRLCESQQRNPKRQIISLRRLIDDIRNHKNLLSRENFIGFDGLPFTPGSAPRSRMDSDSERAQMGFDRLSGVKPEQRSRSDVIADKVFELLDQKLEDSGYDNIREYGNKFIAHAADRTSRETLENTQTGISLDGIEHCHKAICQIANIVSGHILWDVTSSLFPESQFDQLEFLDKAWLPANELPKLREFWQRHAEEVRSWQPETVDLRPKKT